MFSTRAITALAALALLAGFSAAADAQLKNPFGSSNKGHIRGLDVTSLPDVVFVLDLSAASDPPAPPSIHGSLGDEVGGMVRIRPPGSRSRS